MTTRIIMRNDGRATAEGETEIFGTSGMQTVTVLDGASVTFRSGFNTGGDIIRLNGRASDFTVSISGSNVTLRSAIDNISVVIPIGNIANTITFDNGDSRSLAVVGGMPMLGGQPIIAAPVPVVAGPGTFAVTGAASAVEGQTVTFTVTRTDASEAETVLFNVAGASPNGAVAAATVGADFNPASGAVTFAAGAMTATFTVTLVDDNIAETLEGYVVSVLSADGSRVLAETSSVIIDGVTFALTAGQVSNVTGAGNAVDAVASFIDDQIALLARVINPAGPGASVDAAERAEALAALVNLAPGANSRVTISALNEVEDVVVANRIAIARNFEQIFSVLPTPITLAEILDVAAQIQAQVDIDLARPGLDAVSEAALDLVQAVQTNGRIVEALLNLANDQFGLGLTIGTYNGPAVPANPTLDQLLALAPTSVAAVSALAVPSVAAIFDALDSVGDVFTLTANADNITGTVDDDIFNGLVTDLQSVDRIDGGAGNDILNLTGDQPSGVIDSQFQNVRNIESLIVAQADVTLAQQAAAAGINSLNLGGSGPDAQIVTLNGFGGDIAVTGTSRDETVNVSLAVAGTKTLNLGSGEDTVNVVASAAAAAGSIAVNFVSGAVGNGADNSVTISAGAGRVAVNDEGTTIQASGVTDVFNVVGLDGNGQIDPAQNRGNFNRVVLGTEADDVYNVGNTGGSVYINAGLGDDSFTVDAGLGQRHFMVGGAGNDTLNLSGNGEVVVLAGGGDDTATVSGPGRFDLGMGDGNDTVTANNVGTLVASLGSGNNTAEVSGANGNVTITAGDGANTISARAASLSITAGNGGNNVTIDGSGNHRVSTGSGNDDIFVGSGNGVETISAGAGDDIVSFVGGSLNTKTMGQDTLDGGDGFDTLVAGFEALRDNANAVGTSRVTGFEAITIDAGNGEISSALRLNGIQTGITVVNSLETFVGTGAIVFDAVDATLNLGVEQLPAQTIAVESGNGASDRVLIANTALANGAVGVDVFNRANIQAREVEELVIDTSAAGSARTQNIGNVNISSSAPMATPTVEFVGSNSVVAGQVNGRVVDASGLSGNASITATSSNIAGNTFTGSANGDTIRLGTGRTTMDLGAGDDTLIIGGPNDAFAALPGALGSQFNGGEGADTLTMSSRVAADLTNPVNVNLPEFIDFEKLRLTGNNSNGDFIDVSRFNVERIVSEVSSPINATVRLVNFESGQTLEITNASNVNHSVEVEGADIATNDMVNLVLTNAGAGTATYTASVFDVENVDIVTNDAGMGVNGAATQDVLNLAGQDMQSITVRGNNGLDLQQSSAALTSFDASGVVGDGSADSARQLGVRFQSANNTVGASVSIVGGAGNDVLGGARANDSFNLAMGGADTVVLGESVATNGLDAVTGFTAGRVSATGGADVLALNGGLASLRDANGSAPGLIFNATTSNTQGDLRITGGANLNVWLVTDGNASLNLGNVKDVTAATALNGEILVENGASGYILHAADEASTVFNVFRVFDGNGLADPSVDARVELLGTVALTNTFGELDISNIGSPNNPPATVISDLQQGLDNAGPSITVDIRNTPVGSGLDGSALFFQTGPENANRLRYTVDVDDVRLGNISDITFDTFVVSENASTDTPSIRLIIDADGDLSTTNDRVELIWEEVYQPAVFQNQNFVGQFFNDISIIDTNPNVAGANGVFWQRSNGTNFFNNAGNFIEWDLWSSAAGSDALNPGNAGVLINENSVLVGLTVAFGTFNGSMQAFVDDIRIETNNGADQVFNFDALGMAPIAAPMTADEQFGLAAQPDSMDALIASFLDGEAFGADLDAAMPATVGAGDFVRTFEPAAQSNVGWIEMPVLAIA